MWLLVGADLTGLLFVREAGYDCDMKKLAMLLVLGWLFATALPAQTLPEELPGTWLSPKVKFVISNTGHGWKVQGWEDCLPEWCSWGEVPLSLIATSNRSKTYTHALAVWNSFGGAYIKNVIFKFDPSGLQAEIFTVYDPNVGRSDYLYATPMTKNK
jgi:hypothetical protein